MEPGIQLDGYTFDRCVRTTARSQVFAGRRDRDGIAVMGKLYEGGPDRARREMQILQRLSSPLVLKVVALEHSRKGSVLVTKLFEGRPLVELFADEKFHVGVFLRVARQAADALVAVHDQHVIHRDISPGNILVNQKTKQLCLIDFGSAQRFGASSLPDPASSLDGGGTLRYVSPEQTGRMNRGVDFRSDLYSLGAVLYHVAAGRPPFESDDALTLLHAHFAKRPRAPRDDNPALPRPVERILLKLLEKEPDHRYQSARALGADLKQCEGEIEQLGHIPEDLRLGSADAPDRPVFRTRLYGCEAQLRTLREAFSGANAGRFCPCVIYGPAGSGKTSLTHELRKVASERKAWFAQGAFESSGTLRPGTGWSAALSSLAQQMLVKDQREFDEQRVRIERELGSLVGVITDFAPEMRFVLGEQSAPPLLEADQALNRLCQAVARLIAGFAAPEAPLVLVLDDAQWMDAASRALLRFLVREAKVEGLQLIVASRAPESESEDLLRGTELMGESADVSVVLTGPLSHGDLEAMLCEALETTPEAAAGLIEQVLTKTGGIPLLVQQFIGLMADQGVLVYRHPEGWAWDERAIGAADIADDTVAVMSRKIDGLDPALQRMIKYASVIGREFDVDTLARLVDRSSAEVADATLALTRTGLICACDAGLRFSHDRIRQAAHEALPTEDRAKLHAAIGWALLDELSETEQAARQFEIVDHLNQGDPATESNHIELFDLNVRAARRALGKGAPDAAGEYLDCAADLIEAEVLVHDLARRLELSLLGCEAALFSGRFDDALGWLEPLGVFEWDRIGGARIAAHRVRVLALTRHPEETIRYALGELRGLSVRWPLHPSWWRIVAAQARTEWVLRKRDASTLFRPPGRNPRLPILLITGPSGASMTRVDSGIAALASCMAVESYARHGCVSRPGYSLSAYVSFMLLYWPWPQRALRYLEMIDAWDERIPDPLYTPRGRVNTLISIAPWVDWRRKTVEPLGALAVTMGELGDFEQAAYALFLRASVRAYVGDPVAGVRDDLARAGAALRVGHLYPEPIACLGPYALLADEAGTIEERLSESEAFVEAHGEISTPYVATMWMMVSCILERPDIARDQSDRVYESLMRVAPYVHIPDHYFYRGLSAAMLAEGTRGRERRRLRACVAQSQRFLARRAGLGPDFAHMSNLLAAERAQMQGRLARARALYHRAVEQARQAGYRHHVALGQERGAALERRTRHFSQAALLLDRARAEYKAWGATRKVALLAGR